MFEVELKFPLADVQSVLARIEKLGVQPEAPLLQSDSYFNHPARDFAQTDEAFRLRRVGERNFATYKGAILDKETKTRREIEIGLESGAEAAGKFEEMLALLGFRRTAVVNKTRVTWHLAFEGRNYELALDRVEGVGTYLEIESLAVESEWHLAREGVLALAARLGLSGAERRSYLAMLLESRSR